MSRHWLRDISFARYMEAPMRCWMPVRESIFASARHGTLVRSKRSQVPPFSASRHAPPSPSTLGLPHLSWLGSFPAMHAFSSPLTPCRLYWYLLGQRESMLYR